MGCPNLQLQNLSSASFSLLLLLLPAFVSGQDIDLAPIPGKDSISITIEGLPELSAVVRSEEAKAAKIPPPHYEYLWVFSDGEFINQSKDATVSHLFIGEDGATGPGTAHAFTTGVYSDDHLDLPPSARAVDGNNPVTVTFKAVPRQEVVTDGLIKLSSNQRGFVAGDKTVFILSVKNPNDFRIFAYLLFLSDPVIETKIEGDKGGDVQYEIFKNELSLPVSASFVKSRDLDPLDTAFALQSIDNQWFPENLKKRYNAAFRHPFALESGEERHFFVQFNVDEDLFDKGPDEGKGALRFISLVTVDQSAGPDNFLTPQDSALIESLAIGDLLDSLNSIDQPAGNFVADISTFEGEITRSHDPNYIKTEACECPDGSDGAFKLFCTVHFSNEGTKETNNIAVSVTFPAEYDIFSIPDTLLSIYPNTGLFIQPVRDAATNTVRWNLAGFQLFPEAQFGLGHPLTYGEFQFTVLANPANGSVDSIPYLQACIEFDGQEEVCTVPVKPVEVETDAAARALQCGSCVSAGSPGGGTGEPPLPWWLLILLSIIAFILLIVAAIRRRLFGGGRA
ncbi:MAG: hypothetical protein H6557_07415 [Lewinellaceae bacterium]|nr:hypothetical protein [Lewinellaceae bacterium]